jgi:hypothetical protein
MGYSVTIAGAFIGALEAGLAAFGFGYILAHSINWIVGLVEGMFLSRIEILRTVLDDTDGGD